MKKQHRGANEGDQPDLPVHAPPSQQNFRGLPWYLAVEKAQPSRCHECNQPTNVYHRPIASVTAKALIRLFHLDQRRPEKPWHHIKTLYPDRGDWAKLKYWGFIEEAGNTDACKKTSGFWRITDFGRRFVLCQESVPKYAVVKWSSEVVAFAGEAVTIRQCLEYRNRFCYAELMRQPVDWSQEKEA